MGWRLESRQGACWFEEGGASGVNDCVGAAIKDELAALSLCCLVCKDFRNDWQGLCACCWYNKLGEEIDFFQGVRRDT
jgi:hypothetical protein